MEVISTQRKPYYIYVHYPRSKGLSAICLRELDFIHIVVTYKIENSKILSGFWDCYHYNTSRTLCIEAPVGSRKLNWYAILRILTSFRIFFLFHSSAYKVFSSCLANTAEANISFPDYFNFSVSDKAKLSIPSAFPKRLLAGINETLNTISPENSSSNNYVYLATINNLKLLTLIYDICF